MIEKIYTQGTLSAAAYARWDKDQAEISTELINNRGFTQSQIEELFFTPDSIFIVNNYIQLANGFSATIFEERASGELTVAFRGTEPGILSGDIVADLLVLLGNPDVPLEQVFNQSNSIDQFLADSGLSVDGQLQQPVNFTGHSLGGYLALIAAYKYSAGFGEVYTYNSLGLNPLENLWESMAGIFSGRPIDESRIHNYFADKGWEAAASPVLARPGEQQGVFIEEDPFPASSENHSIARLVQSLSAYRVLAALNPQLDSSAGLESIYAILDASSNIADQSIEVLLDKLGNLIGGDLAGADVKADIGLFYQQVLANGLTYDIEPVATDSAALQSMATTAGQDTEVGRGYRYSLVNLLPLAVTGGLVGTDADSSTYDTANFSATFLAMRSEFLGLVLQRNQQDLSSYPTVIENPRHPFSIFTDIASATEIQTFSFAPQAKRYIFGSDGNDLVELNGAALGDQLFGQGGDDALRGFDGSDILDGGAGQDSLNGGPGDDILFGGQGEDRFLWSSGDGNDLIGDYDDGGDRIVINGIDLSALRFARVSNESPFFIDPRNPDIVLHYSGDALSIRVGGNPEAGGIVLGQYLALAGADYGIALHDYDPGLPDPKDVTVTRLGAGDTEVDPSAFWRQQTVQGGIDWPDVAIRFNADDVANYSGGSLHGTLGGAFEGGPVADHLTGNIDANALHGLAGQDRIEGGPGDDFLEGGGGSDQLYGGGGADFIFAGARAGLASELDPASQQGQFYLAQITENPADSNVLDGGSGDDYLSGGAYTDYLDGGEGNNYLLGGTGEDRISGGADREVIYGDSALHYRYVELTPGIASEQLEIAFADGSDVVGQYNDVIHAGAGNDTVWGELGDDDLHGEEGDDNLIGDRYHDPEYFRNELLPYGDTSPVMASSLHGNDRLYGGAGSDLLQGLGGSDFLAGGKDADTLQGGSGDDTYFLAAGDGLDYVDDEEGIHTLLFSGIAIGDLQVVFEGDQVFVGTGYGAEGFYLARSQWGNVRIALDTPEALIEASRLDTHYYDAAGNLLLSLPGTGELSQAERNGLFTVDDSDADRPRIVIGDGIDEVEIEALAGGVEGAVMRIGGKLQLLLSAHLATRLTTGLDSLFIFDGPILSLTGFAGTLFASGNGGRIVGSDLADTIYGGSGDDSLQGRGGNDRLSGNAGRDFLAGEEGNDYLDGGTASDVLRGGAGDDNLRGGSSFDFLDGGAGSDELNGGYGPDTYYFAPGDGQDQLSDPSGYHYFEFGAGINPASVVLNYTGTSASEFRMEYGGGDGFTSRGTFSSYWINGITVAGVAIPLLQRSDLVDGSFADTRWNDVFEGGAGSDTITVNGWGDDVVRFLAGDGQDTIKIDNNFYPEVMGELRFAADVDLGAMTYSFSNGNAVIGYGAGDQVSLETDTVFSFRDNVFGRFTLASEADPDWIPVIRAEGYVGYFYGSYGEDHLIGNANVETIFPGYGNDIIEAGGGPDRIVLNDVYMYQGSEGIGHKTISGGGGNDIIETPLHQGLVFNYHRGDGHDIIDYDWSYSREYPYRFGFDGDGAASFLPRGSDTVAFGEGIALADLRFIRTGDALNILLRDGSGSIRVPQFFHAWDIDAPVDGAALAELLFQEGPGPDSLLHPAILAIMPRSPVAALQFADGTRFDMGAVLDSYLELSAATLLGSEGDDELQGGEGDDVIHALGGNDNILDFSGNNLIEAGPGNDSILVAGSNSIDPGPDDDVIHVVAGVSTIQFGPGSGHDLGVFNVDTASVTLEMAEGLLPGAVSVALEDTEWGPLPQITLADTGDTFILGGLRHDPLLDEWSADPGGHAFQVRFADGTVISGGELFDLARGIPGEILTGTAKKDSLNGTEGNDTLLGDAGKDILLAGAGNDVLIGGRGHDTLSGESGSDTYIFAVGDGHDTINNADPDPRSRDILQLADVDYDEVWLTRKHGDLLVSIAGSDDRVQISNWYGSEEGQLDAIHAGGRVLLRDQVDQLVSAMAVFDAPAGEGEIITEQVRLELEPVLTSVWQMAG